MDPWNSWYPRHECARLPSYYLSRRFSLGSNLLRQNSSLSFRLLLAGLTNCSYLIEPYTGRHHHHRLVVVVLVSACSRFAAFFPNKLRTFPVFFSPSVSLKSSRFSFLLSFHLFFLTTNLEPTDDQRDFMTVITKSNNNNGVNHRKEKTFVTNCILQCAIRLSRLH